MRADTHMHTSGEAGRLFELAENHHFGRNGYFCDTHEARRLYIKAAAKGSAEAALTLGRMCQPQIAEAEEQEKYLRYVENMFTKAAELGRPEGLYSLYEYFSANKKGKGVAPRKAEYFLRQAAEYGSIKSMLTLGKNKLKAGDLEGGGIWLSRALEEDSGDVNFFSAGVTEEQAENFELILGLLRHGAALGSIKCLIRLSFIYEFGQFGQDQDSEYAEALFHAAMDLGKQRPKTPIRDFDQRFPPKTVKPFKPLEQETSILTGEKKQSIRSTH